MLKEINADKLEPSPMPVGIVASEYNELFVQGMLDGAMTLLLESGMLEEAIHLVRVPGAYEIPLITSKMCHSRHPRFGAIICLGVVIQGETHHARLITEAATHEITRQQAQFGIPIIHEILLVESEDQARKRCLDPVHNRGAEAAQTALKMARLSHKINQDYLLE
jgi:6,7-dimethyl-8-ribityllumazine synthase